VWKVEAISGGQRDAQGHGLLIDDIGEARLARRLAHGANDKALSEERMGRIRDLDRVRLWVLEAGIKRWLLLIRLTIAS
jgi:hypothetical protein